MNIKDKYTPKNIDDCIFNQKYILKLYDFLKHPNHNNLILYGLQNSGKNLALDLCLKKIYPKYYLNITENIKNKIYYRYSDIHYHFYINIKTKIEDILPIIKEISQTKKYYTNIPYNILIFDNFQNINIIFQESLRKIMEEFINTKIIIITNKINYLINPIKSRCLLFSIPSNQDDLYNFAEYILKMENIKADNLREFTENSRNINNLLEDINISLLNNNNNNNNNNNLLLIKPLRYKIFDDILYLIVKNKLTQKDLESIKDISHNILIINNDIDNFMGDFLRYILKLFYRNKNINININKNINININKNDLKIDFNNYINKDKIYIIIRFFSDYSKLLLKSYRKIIYIESLLLNIHRIFHE